MIAIIRMHGMIGLDRKKADALDRLMLRGKFSCVLLPASEMPKIFNVKDLVAYGEIDEKTLRMLLAARGKKNNKFLEAVPEALVKGLLGEKTTLKKEGLKPYFGLHPPKGGFKNKSLKLGYPQGVTGKNDKINELIQRML
ncbi:MAG: 50S ribosomal protein L30 [Nanoarchaeota archaeon]|nr:50S ribosomal protein L30 [Nanoarchaeota archaeon]